MTDPQRPAIVKRLDELFAQGKLKPEPAAEFTEAEAQAIERHTERMMYEAFCAALEIGRYRMDEFNRRDLFDRWLRGWRAEQAHIEAEEARAVANFGAMVSSEKPPE